MAQTFRQGSRPGPGNRNARPGIDDRLRSDEKIAYFADPERKAIRPELLDREAQKVARKMQDIPASQLRRFFGSVMELRRRLEADETLRGNAPAIEAEMAFLKASAAYTCRRLGYDNPKKNWQGDPLELVSFCSRHRNSVNDARDFFAFTRHFEAVIAFHKCFARER